MKPVRYDAQKAKLRCATWVDSHKNEFSPEAANEDDPQSDPLIDSVIYSADEEFSNESQFVKKSKRIITQDEDFSEFSDASQAQPKKKKTRHQKIYDDAEIDTSAASEEMSFMAPKKQLTIKDEVLKLYCKWKSCCYMSTKVDNFVSHVTSHLPNLSIKCNEEDNEDVYTCLWESCNFETPNADEVTRHVNFHSYHTKVKAIGALVCKSWNLPECTYSKAGVNLVPDLPDPLQCHWGGDCPLTTNNPNIYYSHVLMHATEIPSVSTKKDKKYKCLWRGCKSEVSVRRRMVDHLRGHSKERVAACPTCGNLFCSRVKLIDHIKRQIPEEHMTYQCTHCSRFYPSERILREHMRHHVNRYKCQFCDMTCATPHDLSNHIRHRHLDEKPFSCEYCDYKAKTQYNLRRHLNGHSTTDNFTCDEEDCNFSCRTIDVMQSHYRSKHEVKPVYCCHMCDSRFARGATLTHHLMKKHNFRWPSGHTRFRYFRNHDDGMFRLQTVRYESLDVVEDITRGEEEPVSRLTTSKKFSIFKTASTEAHIAANFLVKEDGVSDDDPDDPDAFCDDESGIPRAPLNMPSLDMDGPPSPRKVLISIDEVDADGNIITSKTMEAEEVSDIDEIELAQVVSDGVCIL